jgi:hypothetical protein
LKPAIAGNPQIFKTQISNNYQRAKNQKALRMLSSVLLEIRFLVCLGFGAWDLGIAAA